MSVGTAIEEATAKLRDMGIKIDPDVTVVFKTPDGVIIMSHSEEKSELKVEVIFGGEVIELTELLEGEDQP